MEEPVPAVSALPTTFLCTRFSAHAGIAETREFYRLALILIL